MTSSPLGVLLDTNVILDVLLQRQPWVREAAEIWQAEDEGRLAGFVPASALTDIYYVARRLTDATRARKSVSVCMAAFELCSVDRPLLERAYSLDGKDFEDDLQIACAESSGLVAVVTRDVDGFRESSIEVWTPAQCCQKLSMGLR